MTVRYSMATQYGVFVDDDLIATAWGNDANDTIDDKVSKTTSSAQTITSAIAFTGGVQSDTIDEKTGSAGVTIDSLLIKDAALQTSTSLDYFMATQTNGTDGVTAGWTEVAAANWTTASQTVATAVANMRVKKTGTITIAFGGSGGGAATLSVFRVSLQYSLDGSSWSTASYYDVSDDGTGSYSTSLSDSTTRISTAGQTVSYRLDQNRTSGTATESLSSSSVSAHSSYKQGYVMEFLQ